MQNDCFPDATSEWPKTPVSALAEQNPRYPVKKGVEYPFLEMAAVAENFGGILKWDLRRLEGSGLTRFKANDTLFAKITPCPENGKVAFVTGMRGETGLGSTEFIVLSPRDETDPRFLFHLVCSHEVRGRATARMEGSTGRQRVPEDVFDRRLLVPKPNEGEQAAIARVLDAVDAVIDRTRKAVTEAQELQRAVTQQFFYSALGATAYADHPAQKLPVGWKLTPTEKLLAEEPKNGVSPQASTQPPGTPTFSIAAVRDGKVDLSNASNLKYAKVSERIADKFRVRSGDVLVVRGNANPDLVGKAGQVGDFPAGCIYPDITKRIVFRHEGDDTVLPEYAVIAWNHPIIHNQVLRRAKTSNGTLKINNRDVKQIVMPVPPPAEQRRIVGLVAALESKTGALRRKARALEQLKKSLMHDLLTGNVRVDPALFNLEATA
ncbi:restriction endonuclease subunit S [Burkholderia gladioli]|uniref:restriction endonuclease subunit S n=1 Tax=Burkholderia gladioli TaxID=28095 RepID=UPI00163FCAE2|nr:restriction endonuclease subunit S [Burkholderia gladioli]